MIIGISGRKRSGKDTLGAVLVARYGFTRVAFADGVRELTALVFGFGLEHVQSDLFKASRALPPFTGRELLQQIGNGVRDVIGDDTWIKLALAKCVGATENEGKCARCKRDASLHYWPAGHCYSANAYKEGTFVNSKHYVITDVRHPNEVAAVRAAGGKVIRLNTEESARTKHDYVSEQTGLCAFSPSGGLCGLPRVAHPCAFPFDRHPSETSLPDHSNEWIKYDAAFTGSMEENTSRAVRFAVEK